MAMATTWLKLAAAGTLSRLLGQLFGAARHTVLNVQTVAPWLCDCRVVAQWCITRETMCAMEPGGQLQWGNAILTVRYAAPCCVTAGPWLGGVFNAAGVGHVCDGSQGAVAQGTGLSDCWVCCTVPV